MKTDELYGPAPELDRSNQRLGKPFIVIVPSSSVQDGAHQLRRFVQRHEIRVLNTAGPRATASPAIYHYTKAVMLAAFSMTNTATDAIPAVRPGRAGSWPAMDGQRRDQA